MPLRTINVYCDTHAEDIKFPDWVKCRVGVKAAFWAKTQIQETMKA
jgi:hypothetical protein